MVNVKQYEREYKSQKKYMKEYNLKYTTSYKCETEGKAKKIKYGQVNAYNWWSRHYSYHQPKF